MTSDVHAIDVASPVRALFGLREGTFEACDVTIEGSNVLTTKGKAQVLF